MATLFLSYSRDDAERVGLLANALERDGHKVWWDQHISGGQGFADEIEQALLSADLVVVCWTEHSIRSNWVRDEAASGRDRGRLVPVTLDGCPPPLGFRQFQTIDLSKWSGRPRSRVLTPLKSVIKAKDGDAGAQGKAVLPVAIGKRRTGLSAMRPAVAVAVALFIPLGGTLLYSHLWSRPDRIAPEVMIGQFALVSANLPRAIPEMLSQEILAAFGAENAVTVVADGGASSSAPFVMDGSISRTEDRVRFTVNIKNTRSGVLLWSRAYEDETADAAVATRQAAVGASQVVRCGLWGASSYQRPMTDQALSLYFNWCNEHWSGSSEQASELDAARRVTVAVPDFSFGWSALALAAVPLAASSSADAEQLRDEGMAAARKSMQLDDQNPEGYMAIAGLLPLERYGEREELLRKAISVRPTECGCERQAYGDFLSSVGRIQEAVGQYERARAMRPLAPFSNVRFAQALYLVGRNDEADRILGETLKLWPDATSLQLLKMKSALWTGRHGEAITVLGIPDLPLTSGQRSTLIAAFQALESKNAGLRAKSVAELERFAADPRYNDRLVVAMLAALGARDAALEAAANLVRARGLFDAEVLFEPNLAAARSEAAYVKLVGELGLTKYWRGARNAPDICRDLAKPSYCKLS